MIDIIKFYQDHNVDYSTSGKNISEGWVNINCVFCNDPSNHLGIFIKKTEKVKCWRCGGHNLIDVLKFFSDISIKELYKKYSSDEEVEEIKKEFFIKEKLPLSSEELSNIFIKNSSDSKLKLSYISYLAKRNFNYFDIEKEWRVRQGIETGEFRYRLMIPIFSDNQIVSFQGRDVTEKQKEKYKTCHNTNIKNYLYGLDYVLGNRVIITEGVTDVWRLGKGNAIATFGIEFTDKQFELIRNRFKNIIIFYDSEPQAQRAAKKLKSYLDLFDINCINFKLAGGDPADLKRAEVKKILKLLNNL